MNQKRYNQSKVVKRYIKFLSIAPDTEVVRIVLQKASDGVILSICDVALNAREGDVRIPHRLKHIFAKYHQTFTDGPTPAVLLLRSAACSFSAQVCYPLSRL